jgi:hypothetical protein
MWATRRPSPAGRARPPPAELAGPGHRGRDGGGARHHGGDHQGQLERIGGPARASRVRFPVNAGCVESVALSQDGRELAFATSTDVLKTKPAQLLDVEAVRVLDVTARGGDLIADSRVVWSRTDSAFVADYTRPVCNALGGSTFPVLTMIIDWAAGSGDPNSPSGAHLGLAPAPAARLPSPGRFLLRSEQPPAPGVVSPSWT